MSITVNKDYEKIGEVRQNKVRNLVIAGLEQVKENKTKDFNEVCARLEKKYMNGTICD